MKRNTFFPPVLSPDLIAYVSSFLRNESSLSDIKPLALVSKDWRTAVLTQIISYLDKNKDKLALFLEMDKNHRLFLHNLDRFFDENALQKQRRSQMRRSPITFSMESMFSIESMYKIKIPTKDNPHEAKLKNLYRELSGLNRPLAKLLHFTTRLNTIQSEVKQEIRNGRPLDNLLNLIIQCGVIWRDETLAECLSKTKRYVQLVPEHPSSKLFLEALREIGVMNAKLRKEVEMLEADRRRAEEYVVGWNIVNY